jgi:DNA-binding CsgD family transcriptional regulator
VHLVGGAIEVRWSELATLERVVEGTSLAPSTVAVIDGEPGIGKSHLLNKAAGFARERNLLVVDGGLSEVEQDLPWAGLSSLLRHLDEWQPNGFPTERREQLDRATRRVATGTVTAPEVAFAFAGLVGAVVAERPLVIAVDDMQWLDRPTAMALATALRAVPNGGLTLLIAIRSGHESLLDVTRIPDVVIERISLGGLSVAGVHRVIAQAGIDPPPRPTLIRIHARSAGNPLRAIDLGHAAAAGEPGLEVSSTTDVHRLTIESVDGATVDVARACALMARPTLTCLRMLAPNASHALSSLERAGVLTVVGDEIRFTHSLRRDAMLDGLGTIEARTLHRRIADVVDDPEHAVLHRAEAAEVPDAGLADAMERAAHDALRVGLPDLAARRFDRAAQLTPPDDHEDRWRRLEQLVRQSTTVGDLGHLPLAIELFESATGDEDVRNATLSLAALQRHTDSDAAAAVTCRAGLERLEEPLHRIDVLRFLVRIEQFHDLRIGLATAEQLVDEASRSGDPEAIALADALLASARCLAGLPFDLNVADRFTESLPDRVALHLAEALVWSDRVTEAEQILVPLVARARAQGHPYLIMQYLSQLGDVQLRRGRWHEALRELQESAELSALMGEAGGGQSDCAWLAAAMGDISRARDEIALEAPLVPESAHVWRVQHLARAGFVECCGGAWADAARLLDEARRAAEQLHLFEAAPIPFGNDLVEALLHLGRVDEAEDEAGRLLVAARRAGLPTPLALALRSMALVDSARSEHGVAIDRVGEALQFHAGGENTFEAARTELAAGGILRRAGRRADARCHLEAALQVFDELGAPGFAMVARSGLDRLTTRRAPDQLTEAERRVADLAASGKSNIEISGELFIAVRTVESNLTRVYRKLGVRSRSQLAGVLGSQS